MAVSTTATATFNEAVQSGTIGFTLTPSGGSPVATKALELVEGLRSERPQLRFELNLGGGNFKAQFRRADKSGAVLALIFGEDELARGVAGVKPLRVEAGQSECPIAQLAAGVDAALGALANAPGRAAT